LPPLVARLSAGRATVGELAAPFAVSLPAISRHLKVLERAQLITRSAEGQHRWCRLNRSALSAAADWLAFHERFWSTGFDRLDDALRPTEEKIHS
jgi:DNA-binding transcriptional ArsR family regulator